MRTSSRALCSPIAAQRTGVRRVRKASAVVRAIRASRRVLLALIALAAVLVIACGALPPAPAAPRALHFMAGYKPQANLPFVGAYIAQQRGYFAEQGLSVEITHATGQGEHLKLLLQGTVDVTTGDADSVILRRADGLPVVAFALLGQRGQRAFAVQETSEIRSPKDFEGKTVGYKIYQTPDYVAMLAANGVDRSRIQEVPVGFDPRLLAAGKVDVYPVFESNEPEQLLRLGVPVRLFRPSDYGVPSLGLTYMSRQQLLDEDPARLERFLRATLRGIRDARADPEAAIDVVMQNAPNEDRAHQLAMLKIELDMADGLVAQSHGLGWATTDQWQAFHDSLLAHGGLTRPVPVEQVFTDRILRAAYRDGRLASPVTDRPPTSVDGGPAILVRDVRHVYRARAGAVSALAGVDLDVSAGELLAILGPSGCGKSTLLRMLAGLLEPTGGTVRLAGRSPIAARASHGVGWLAQDDGLLPWRTVRDNVALAVTLGPRRRPEAGRIQATLEQVGLADAADRYPGELSGGMRQRAALARALVAGPAFLFLDEPFANLDELTRERLGDLLLELRAALAAPSRRPTTLLVTHSVVEAVRLADRVLVLSDRPAHVLDDARVPLSRPRRYGQPGFGAWVERLTTILAGRDAPGPPARSLVGV